MTQRSVITPPDGSGLEVDVTNLGSPEEGVPGVSVLAGGVATTTGTKGCVIYTGIPATTVNVEASKTEYVMPSGARKYIAKEVSIAPNLITRTHAYLGHGGRITAEFKNGVTSVEGDTFVAYNSNMGVTPEFEVGSVEYGTFSSEGKYETEPGSVTATGTNPRTLTMEGYGKEATTAVSSSYYPSGDLFPFTTAWTVYAGDCTENNPQQVEQQHHAGKRHRSRRWRIQSERANIEGYAQPLQIIQHRTGNHQAGSQDHQPELHQSESRTGRRQRR